MELRLIQCFDDDDDDDDDHEDDEDEDEDDVEDHESPIDNLRLNRFQHSDGEPKRTRTYII